MISLVAFSVGNQEFAMPLAVVQEVRRIPSDIAAMPDADEVVLGSAAVAGAILPLLSLRALLALPASGDNTRARVLVVMIGRKRVGLVVDEMHSILRVSEEMVDAVPQVLLRGQAEARIQAICRLEDGDRLVSVLAADQLLREDITSRLLLDGAGEHTDMALGEDESAMEQFLLFRIGEEEFGLPLAAVEEVTQMPATFTPLPNAPGFVRGVMNLRGQVIPVIDQAQRFGATTLRGAKPRVIVAQIGELKAGFIVDAVSEVVKVPADALHKSPDFGNEDGQVFERVANLPGEQRIVLIVNPRELLDRAERDLLASIGSKDAKAAL